MTIQIFTPEISVILKKTTSRDQSGKSERYTAGAKEFDLKPFLTEDSAITMSRQINAPAGTFQISVDDRGVTHDRTLDSLYGIAEPMDVIEIRMARSPHEYQGKLPLVFRGVITEVRRDESMSQDGKPNRTVILAGHDWGKFLQIIQERYIRGNPLSEAWLSGLVMQIHYDIKYGVYPAGEVITQMVQKIGNKFIGDYGLPDIIPPFLIDVSGADPSDMVMPQGYQAFPDGTLWGFLQTYGDVGPFYELFLDDTEAGPKLIYRKPPFFTADGDMIHGTLPESVNIDPSQVQRLSVSRSDADVANWVWINMRRISLISERNAILMSMAENPGASFMDYPNCRRELYGIRTMTVETNHGFMFQGAPKEQKAIDETNMANYREKKTRQIRLSNMDNSVFETGSMTIAGNEKVKIGTNVRIQRGRTISLYYAQSVTHSFRPFKSFTTTVQFIRGTGFVNRSSNDQLGIKAPYLEEIGHGPYESTKA